MITFFDTEERLTMSQIEEIEIKLNLTLPMDYKLHLLKYNGGYCKPSVFSFFENGKLTTSSIEWFLAIYDGEYDNLMDNIESFKIQNKRMPISVVPIANDGLGNLVCIDTNNHKIYFWDHEREIDYSIFNDSVRDNLYLIADNFNQFIANLKVDPEDFEPNV